MPTQKNGLAERRGSRTPRGRISGGRGGSETERRRGEEKVESARLQDGEEEVIQCLRGRGVEEKGERRRAEDGLAKDRK